jgi:hypothetical protein
MMRRKKKGSEWVQQLRAATREANNRPEQTIRIPETALKHMMRYARLGFQNTYFYVPELYAEKVQEKILSESGIKLFINPTPDTRGPNGELRFEVEW